MTSVIGLLLDSGCSQKNQNNQSTSSDGSISSERVTPDQASPEQKARLSLSEPLKAEARAGQIKKEDELVKGPAAISRVGDWKLYNNRVAFVIHGMGFSRSWSGSTGHIIDAAPVDQKGGAQVDLLGELLTALGTLRVIQAQRIEVVKPKEGEKQAIIRVTATNVGIPILDAVLQTEKLPGTIEIDYILRPDTTYLEIVTRYKSDDRERDLTMGDVIIFGNFIRTFAPSKGWTRNSKLINQKQPWIAGISLPPTRYNSLRGASYLLAPASSQTTLNFPLAQFEILPAMGYTSPSSEKKAEYRRYFFVGSRGLEDMLVSLRGLRKEKKSPLRKGQINGMKDLQQVEVMLRKKGQPWSSQIFPDTEGLFSFQVTGEFEVVAQAYGREPVTLSLATDSKTDVTFKPGAKLKIRVKEKKVDGSLGGFLPTRVQLAGPQNQLLNLLDSNKIIEAIPGDYTVTVSRGLEYEYWQKKVTLKAGETKTFDVVLQRAVEVQGVNADMHLHAAPSIDSSISLEDRVSSLVAEGLQFAVATDHDTTTDYTPTITKLKLTSWVRSVMGQEVSPIALHTNIFPIVHPPNSPTYYALPFITYKDGSFQKALSAPAIWKLARDLFKAKVIQINHPRTFQSFFNIIKYDPKKGVKALKPGVFDNNWDTIELYNGKGKTSDFLLTTLWDWFSLLNQGFYKTGVGNSDTHSRGLRPGIPRTIIKAPTQKADQLDPAKVIANLKAGRAQIYAGPYIVARTASGKESGDTVQQKTIKLSITIQAPSWVPVNYVKIYGNGKLLQKLDVAESKDRVRLQKTVEITPTQDTWIVVLAGHETKKLTPIYPKFISVSMTNPIYIDIDGNGFKPTFSP